MKKLLIAIIGAALLWSGYWFWQASQQRNAFERWFEDRHAAGWAADYSALEITGFPNRIDTTLTAPRLGDPASGLVWEAPFFQILRLSYNPGHVIMVWPEVQRFATPETEVTLRADDLKASLRMADLVQWVPERLVIAGQGVDVVSEGGVQFAAETAQLSAERMAAREDQYRVAFDASDVSGVIPNWIEVTSTEDENPVLDLLRASAVVTFDRPLNRSAIEAGRPQIAALDLTIAEAEWSGLELAMAGELLVDGMGVPTGRLTLKVRNWRDMLAQEAEAGRISATAMGQIEFTLNLISTLSGNPETLDLPFDFAEGKVWLGPLSLGAAPNLRIP